MTLGEKLTSLKCIIYEFAKERLESAGLDPTLSELVMGNVYRRFQEDAYHASLLNQLNAAQQSEAAQEAQQTATAQQAEPEPTEQKT